MGGYFSSQNATPSGAQATTGGASGVKDPAGEANNNTRDTVIIPVDPSKQAETAFEWYLRHVHKPGNFVYIVHCQEIEHPSGVNYPDYAIPRPGIATYHSIKAEAFDEQLKKARESGKTVMAKYEKKLQENDLRGGVYAEVGRPGEVVVNAADKYNASQIVMGSRGFGLVRRTILGSVSEYVVHHSKVPVTIIPRETQSWFF